MGNYYSDVRQYLDVLHREGKLVRVARSVCKDTEAHPLVRLQFRGLPEAQRKAFLFENVHGVGGREYSIPLAVGIYACSRDVYSLGLACKSDEIYDRWARAIANPEEPHIVTSAPAQEEIHLGSDLLSHGGLDEFPIPVSTPGFDVAPYITTAHWVTKDVETGIRNVGNYRAQVKAKDKTGIGLRVEQHVGIHWEKRRQRGEDLEAALVIGVTPNIVYTSVAKLPYGKDEFAVAGGLVGEPVPLVKCKTIDLEVPATAEIVIEGKISTRYLEPEGPFGEYTGYIGARVFNPYFEVSCITHRRNPVWTSIISQMPPSESTKMKQIGAEGVTLNFLRNACNLPDVIDVAWHEMSGSWEFCVIRMRKTNQSQPWQALGAASSLDPSLGKVFIVVDDDIDARDLDAVVWSLSFRMMPHLDLRVIEGKSSHFDPSAVASHLQSVEDVTYPPPRGTSALLIDATRKWAYPPVSLPERSYMERAQKVWGELGLPELTLREPWYGYSLGAWTAEDVEEAQAPIDGEYYKIGEKQARNKREI